MTGRPDWDELSDEYTVVLADGSCRRVVCHNGRHVFLAKDGKPRGTHASVIEAIRAHPALHTLDADVVELHLGNLDGKEVIGTLDVAPGTPLGAQWEIDGEIVLNCGWDGYGRYGQLWVSEELGFGFGFSELEGEEILYFTDADANGYVDNVSGVRCSRVGGLEITDEPCWGKEFKAIGRRRLKVSDYLVSDYVGDREFFGRGLLELSSDVFGDRALLRELSPDTRYVKVNGRDYVRWRQSWERLDGTPVDLRAGDPVWAEFARTRIEVAPEWTVESWRAWVPTGPATHVEAGKGEGLFAISACNPRRRRLSAATNADRTRTLVEMIWKFDANTVDNGLYAIRPAVRRSLDTDRAEQSWVTHLDGRMALTLGRCAGQVAVFRLGAEHVDIVNCGAGPSLRVPCEIVDIDPPPDAPELPAP